MICISFNDTTECRRIPELIEEGKKERKNNNKETTYNLPANDQ